MLGSQDHSSASSKFSIQPCRSASITLQRFRLEKQEPSFALHFPLRILGTCPKEILKGTESQSPGTLAVKLLFCYTSLEVSCVCAEIRLSGAPGVNVYLRLFPNPACPWSPLGNLMSSGQRAPWYLRDTRGNQSLLDHEWPPGGLKAFLQWLSFDGLLWPDWGFKKRSGRREPRLELLGRC